MIEIPHTPSAYWAIPGLKGILIPDKKLRLKYFPLEVILSSVCAYYEVDVKDVLGKRRFREIVMARQFVMYFARMHTRMTLKGIAEYFGKDHTSCIHSIQAINSQLTSKMGNNYKNDHFNMLHLFDNQTIGDSRIKPIRK